MDLESLDHSPCLAALNPTQIPPTRRLLKPALQQLVQADKQPSCPALVSQKPSRDPWSPKPLLVWPLSTAQQFSWAPLLRGSWVPNLGSGRCCSLSSYAIVTIRTTHGSPSNSRTTAATPWASTLTPTSASVPRRPSGRFHWAPQGKVPCSEVLHS